MLGLVIIIAQPKKYISSAYFQITKYRNIDNRLSGEHQKYFFNEEYIIDPDDFLIKIRRSFTNPDICNISDRRISFYNKDIETITINITRVRPYKFELNLSGISHDLLEKCTELILSKIKILDEQITIQKINELKKTYEEKQVSIEILRKKLSSNITDQSYLDEIKILNTIKYKIYSEINFIESNRFMLIDIINVREISSKIIQKIAFVSFIGFIISFIFVARKIIYKRIKMELKIN
jgi:hypothetical protein